jgi:hypothetical protein
VDGPIHCLYRLPGIFDNPSRKHPRHLWFQDSLMGD